MKNDGLSDGEQAISRDGRMNAGVVLMGTDDGLLRPPLVSPSARWSAIRERAAAMIKLLA